MFGISLGFSVSISISTIVIFIGLFTPSSFYFTVLTGAKCEPALQNYAQDRTRKQSNTKLENIKTQCYLWGFKKVF